MQLFLHIFELPFDLWQALWLTLRLALITTIFLILIGIPIAYWLTYSRCKGIAIFEALLSVPLVLPPTVIGFYVLIVLAPQEPLGKLWSSVFGTHAVFSFSGLIAGSIVYSLPFAVQPFQAAIRNVQTELLEAPIALGASLRQTFLRVVLPNARHGVYIGIALSFAHTMGEFGVVLMLGGNIPGETRVASIALYDEVQKLNYANANTYALILLLISFSILVLIALIRRRGVKYYY